MPGTPVRMADGSAKPIEQVRVGDEVLAGDGASGQNRPEKVTATIVGNGDKQLVEITVAGVHGSTAVITATDGHPFWVANPQAAEHPGGHWVDAADLRRGDWLKTSDGRLVRVAGTHALEQNARVYNLTVADLHTYFVSAGSSTVLVHNDNDDDGETGPRPKHIADHTRFDSNGNIRPVQDQTYYAGRQLPEEQAQGKWKGSQLVPGHDAGGRGEYRGQLGLHLDGRRRSAVLVAWTG